MPLKYLITLKKWDTEVIDDKKRGESEIERTMGIEWDVNLDTVRFGTSGALFLFVELR